MLRAHTINHKKKEFGDFQTPFDLAVQVASLIKTQISQPPKTIIEPTCGLGSFIEAAYLQFGDTASYKGFEIHKPYLQLAKKRMAAARIQAQLKQADFFSVDWPSYLKAKKGPILFIGNPPWVTNSTMGMLSGHNLPVKSNVNKLSGLDALTGKSNFDISENILSQLLLALQGRRGYVGMLCKTRVARKIIQLAHDKNLYFNKAKIYHISAAQSFKAMVEACLFLFQVEGDKNYFCDVYKNTRATQRVQKIGFQKGRMLAHISNYKKLKKHLQSQNSVWRSGLKHDCSKVMELVCEADGYRNGLGEKYSLEKEHVYPLLKSSDLANNRLKYTKRRILVTQKFIGEDTRLLKLQSPKVWAYLQAHNEWFRKRKSAVYKNQPPYGLFGVGPYSFAPWKVAISGLYKKLNFCLVEPIEGRPVLLDDTCYFIPFSEPQQALKWCQVLSSSTAQKALETLIFWDEKRPIKKSILDALDIEKLTATATGSAARC